MARGVLQEVQQGLGQPLPVGPQRAAGRARGHRKAVAENGLRHGDDAGHEVAEAQRLRLEQHPVAGPCQGGQVFHQPAHQIELVYERFPDRPHLIHGGLLPQHVEVATADGEGRAQLVRHRGQECVLHPVQLAQLF